MVRGIPAAERLGQIERTLHVGSRLCSHAACRVNRQHPLQIVVDSSYKFLGLTFIREARVNYLYCEHVMFKIGGPADVANFVRSILTCCGNDLTLSSD